MSDRMKKVINKSSRQTRTRSHIHGTAKRPRMSVNVSNKHISVQLINDDESKTIVSASTSKSTAKGTMTEKASVVGSEIAKAAKAKKIKHVAFDRGSKQYHGRIKALADAARENGLEF